MATKKTEEKNELIINDIVNLSRVVSRSSIAVIDTIVQRGGFKGEELSTIGQLRDQSLKIVQLIEAYESEKAQQN